MSTHFDLILPKSLVNVPYSGIFLMSSQSFSAQYNYTHTVHHYSRAVAFNIHTYRITGNFRGGGGGKIFVVFVVEHWTTNILPTNEATSTTFTCSTSSNHENKIHELSKYYSTTDILPPPRKLPAIRYLPGGNPMTVKILSSWS